MALMATGRSETAITASTISSMWRCTEATRPRWWPARISVGTQATAPMRFHRQNPAKDMREMPATKGTKVRATGTKRVSTSASTPWRS